MITSLPATFSTRHLILHFFFVFNFQTEDKRWNVKHFHRM